MLAWFKGLSGLAKMAIFLAIVTTLLGGLWKYNEGVRDQGRAEIELEWAQKLEEQREGFEQARAKLEQERASLAKQYYAERAVRQDVQRQMDKEREDAIRASSVAATQCFDERMRDNWNRSSGHGAGGSGSSPGGGVAPAVPR